MNNGAMMVFDVDDRIVVTNQAMGARCAVAGDFDGDGRQDLVSASSNDNAVSWFRNEGETAEGRIQFSIKKQITWNSLGSRIVTVADIDGDGDVDVVGASYYDNTLRWFSNDGTGTFTPHVISDQVNEGQGLTVGDFDNDGDADIATASSGDNTIAVFKNIAKGQFCEIKEIVDDNAVGARTVIASDLNGDGWIDLVSASKDDDTVAWYPNDGTGHFPTKKIISSGEDSTGAYSLIAADIDQDGTNDLVVASNGNDRVTLWRNDGHGNFEKTVIYDNADFVLSVTAVDFDRDGDIDVASASFFDGHINWYENVDGQGRVWKNHTIYVGLQGHYVSTGDMDGDGDDDLIAVTHAENTVAVFLARTECDLLADETYHRKECCHLGTQWNGTACEPCSRGMYGVGSGMDAVCEPCPVNACVVPGHDVLPATCSGISGCADIKRSVAECTCPVDSMKNPLTDSCILCPEGQFRPENGIARGIDTIGKYTEWEMQQGVCRTIPREDVTNKVIGVTAGSFVGLLCLIIIILQWWKKNTQAKRDAAWIVDEKEITYDDPVLTLGNGSFGSVQKGYFRGTPVAIKRVMTPTKEAAIATAPEQFRDGARATNTPGMKQTKLSLCMGPANKGHGVVSRTLSAKEIRHHFVEEMRTLAKLRHPCIVTTMGAVMGPTPFLLMEFMENGSLRDLLSNKTFPLDAEQTLPLIRDILQGLRFLHSSNPPIIHGDLKCASVLVDANFRAKISDFGFSRKGLVVGTPFYMSPEVLSGGQISKQSDIYSFGILLWEVMTHKIPYEKLEKSNMRTNEILELVRLGKLRPDCHEGLDHELVACMEDCWAQEPRNRPTLEDLEMKIIPLCGQNLFSVMYERNKHTQMQSSLLHDVFPEHISNKLLRGEKVTPESHDCVTVFFSDIVGFTSISSHLSAAEVSDLLDRLYTAFDSLAEQHGVFKLETIGDAWVGVTNLTKPQQDHAARIARFAIDVVRVASSIQIHTNIPDMGNVRVRVGFHSGAVVASVVGTRNPRYCLFGDTMNTAARMESTSEALRIQCTEQAAQLVKEQDEGRLRFQYRGAINVKGKDLMRTMWLMEDAIENTEANGNCGQVDQAIESQQVSSVFWQKLKSTQVSSAEERFCIPDDINQTKNRSASAAEYFV